MTPRPANPTPIPPARSNRAARRAFTLIECVCAIVVIATTSAVVLPILSGATSAYANAVRARETSENTAYALDRCLGLLRDAPVVTRTGALSITSATPTALTFSDGRSVALTNGQLTLTNESGASGTLLTGVTTFEIGYRGQNGTDSTLAAPGTTWVFTVRIVCGGFEMTGNAFARARSLGS